MALTNSFLEFHPIQGVSQEGRDRTDRMNNSLSASRNRREQEQAEREANRIAQAAQASYNAEAKKQMDIYNSMLGTWTAAMMTDLDQARGANAQRKGNQRTAADMKSANLTQYTNATSGILGGADKSFLAGIAPTGNMKQSRAKLDSPDAYMQQAVADSEKYLKQIQDEGSAHYADIRNQTQNFLEDLRSMKTEELGNYRNMASQTIANQAQAIAANQKAIESQITNAMMSMGHAANSPATKSMLIQSRYAAMQNFSMNANQIAISYNDKMQDILTNANNRIAGYTLPSIQLSESVYEAGKGRETQAQANVLSTKTAGAQYQQQIAALDRDVWSTVASLSTQYTLARTQQALSVEAARMAGYDNLAEYIGNLDTDYVAMSPTTTSILNGFLEMQAAKQSLMQNMT